MGRFLMILQMIPAIIGIVKQVEAAIPGVGQGPTKLNLVLNTVNAAAQAIPEVKAAFNPNDDLNGTVTSIANAAVSTLNAAGVFQKK